MLNKHEKDQCQDATSHKLNWPLVSTAENWCAQGGLTISPFLHICYYKLFSKIGICHCQKFLNDTDKYTMSPIPRTTSVL